MQSYGLKTTRALGYAKMNSPQAHARYGTSAAYLDVHTCVPPWHQLDHEAGQDMAAMALAKVKYDGELFQYMRDSNEGPLFGEGANQFYWAGRADGVEAQIAGGEDNVPFLDFDLLKLHPQMMNHGMGYMERWYRQGYNHRLGIDSGTPEQVDKYRAQVKISPERIKAYYDEKKDEYSKEEVEKGIEAIAEKVRARRLMVGNVGNKRAENV